MHLALVGARCSDVSVALQQGLFSAFHLANAKVPLCTLLLGAQLLYKSVVLFLLLHLKLMLLCSLKRTFRSSSFGL